MAATPDSNHNTRPLNKKYVDLLDPSQPMMMNHAWSTAGPRLLHPFNSLSGFSQFTRLIGVNLTDGLRNVDWANAQRRRPAVMRQLRIGLDLNRHVQTPRAA